MVTPFSSMVINFTEGSTLTGSCSPITVTVTLNGTVGEGTPPYNFTWDFGDQSHLGHGQDVRHTYSGYGNFDVTLWVVDAVGGNGSVTKIVGAPPPPCPVPVNNIPPILGRPGGLFLLLAGGLSVAAVIG
ncbi:MAG TPA: PKD domain-containing protein, partial [Thermoplasmata archaeon]|nr:PKD domain-containing protein [Thermoplasmata archaeon]